MVFVKLEAKADYEGFIINNPKTAIDFFADWCGPWRAIGPKYELTLSLGLYIGLFQKKKVNRKGGEHMEFPVIKEIASCFPGVNWKPRGISIGVQEQIRP